MKSRSLLGILFLLIGLAGILAASPCRADYDPSAETQRLIDKAIQEKQAAQEALVILKASREKMKQQFLIINDTELVLSNNLRRIRMIDARNKAMLMISTGLNITAINAPEKMAEIGTSLAVDLASEYLRNNYQNLFDTSVTIVLPKLGLDSVDAMRVFNKTMALNDKEIEKRILDEDPNFAESVKNRGWLQKTLSGDKLSDELIALKRAEFMLKDGTKAEQALKALKQELSKKQHELLQDIAALEREIKRLEEDIRSWKRNLGLNEELKKANEWSKSPDTVTFPGNASYDFGTAASNMKQAWQKLASGEYSCSSYYGALTDATQGANKKLDELLRPIHAALAACGSDACFASYRAAAESVYRAYNAQVQGTARQLRQDAKALADGPIRSFGQSLHKWDQNEVGMLFRGEEHSVKMEGQHGDWLGMAIWQYAFGGSAVPPSFYALSVKRLAQSEKLLQDWQDVDKRMKDYYQKGADSAKRSAATVAGLASTASQLAGKLKPNIELWDCFRSEGSYGYDPAMVNFEHVRGQYDRLSHFEAAFAAISRDGEDGGSQLLKAAIKNVELTDKVVEALRGVASVKEKADKLVTSAKELRSAQESNLDISGGQIYNILGNYGVSDSGIKALDERIKTLSDPATLEKEALSQILGMPGYNFKNLVLTKEGIEGLKTSVNKALASIDSARDRYASAYKSAQAAETSLDGALQTMRDRLAPIFPEEVPYFFKDAVLGEYSEPEDSLTLLLRDRVGPAGELPDSGLGSGKLLELYATLSERYHALVDPMLSVARANRYAPALEEILKKLQADSGRLNGLDNIAFSRESSRYSNDAYRIITQANNEGKVEPKSRVNVAYGAIISKLSEISSAYYQRQRLSEAQSTLRNAIASINTFLGNPEAMGGWSAAKGWMDSIGSTKSTVDASVRNHPSIVPLMEQLDGLMGKLKAVAANVDSGTLQRDTRAIHAMYSDFASAYQNKNLPSLTHFLARDWQAADGSDRYELETTLGNSFRVFESIVFKISGLNIQRTGNFYQVSYQAALTGRISRMQKSHEETSNVVDTVVITPDGPRIQKTTGMLH